MNSASLAVRNILCHLPRAASGLLRFSLFRGIRKGRDGWKGTDCSKLCSQDPQGRQEEDHRLQHPSVLDHHGSVGTEIGIDRFRLMKL